MSVMVVLSGSGAMTKTQRLVGLLLKTSDLRDRCRSLLDSFAVSYESYSLADLDCHTPEPFPAVILMKLSPDSTKEMELQERLRRRSVPSSVIYFADSIDVENVVRVMRLGACDVLSPMVSVAAFRESVEEAFRIFQLRDEWITFIQDARNRLSSLSTRRKEIGSRVVAGQTNKAIGIDLGISIKTVEKHRQAVHQKTKTGSLSELIRLHFRSEQPIEAAFGMSRLESLEETGHV